MVFSSIPFLYYFLPLVLGVYFLAPKVLKNTVLLVFSLLFYAWGEPRYVLLMVVTILINYGLGLLIERFRGSKLARLFLGLSLVVSLGFLAYFKYADFFIENFNRLTGLSVNLLGIALPIGISFYTFQIVSYIIDVYRGAARAQKNPLTLATYVALFPQLIAGPIVRYVDIERELHHRTHSVGDFALGARRFVIGLSKKVLLANVLGELCKAFLQSNEPSVLFYWLYVIAFMLQIYFDFSGYSDMAIGIGRMLGFRFLENFNYPFIAKSLSDFWRRWHISLGSWFRDYVYFPMGGSRVKPLRLLLNLFTVWFLTGFWHGAEWNFIVWGLYFGLLLTIEKFFIGKRLEKTKIVGHVYVLVLTSFSFAIFAAGSMEQALSLLAGMFGAGDLPLLSPAFIYSVKSYGLILAISAIAATPLPKLLRAKITENKKLAAVWDVVEILLIAVLFLLSTAYLADGAFNPFLYFRF
ncbi:MAG: MBOAT family protein [Ruminococcaceae bacterium]|nr:MBOAT family protein [Oscillospiraceae bacterium]